MEDIIGADGLDANGNINISGGNLEIWGAKSGSLGDFVHLEGLLLYQVEKFSW